MKHIKEFKNVTTSKIDESLTSEIVYAFDELEEKLPSMTIDEIDHYNELINKLKNVFENELESRKDIDSNN